MGDSSLESQVELTEMLQLRSLRVLQNFNRTIIKFPKPLARTYTEIPIVGQNKKEAVKNEESEQSSNTVNIENIIKEIKLSGPMPIANYIHRCNTGSRLEGYTMNRDPLGVDGDFITSPEISQMFGEMVGVWACHEFMCSQFSAEKTTPLRLIEMGPGRGTMMNDILRILQDLRKYIGTDRSVHVSMVEVSDTLVEKQKQTLATHMADEKITISWFKDVDEIPKYENIPEYIVCHEFFDALPIYKFKVQEEPGPKTASDTTKPPELRQLLVDYDPNNSRKLRYVVSPQSNNKIQKFVSSFMANDPASLIHRGFKEFEVSLQSAGFMSKLSQRIADTQGAGLVVDYGFGGEVVGTEENNFKLDTFRGYRKHKQVDVLAYPGETDLTADVDFDFLAKALLYEEKLYDEIRLVGPVTQRTWLKNMGVDQRLKNLLTATKDKKTRERLIRGYEYMTDPNKMGTRFKCLAIVPVGRAAYGEQLPVTGFNAFDDAQSPTVPTCRS